MLKFLLFSLTNLNIQIDPKIDQNTGCGTIILTTLVALYNKYLRSVFQGHYDVRLDNIILLNQSSNDLIYYPALPFIETLLPLLLSMFESSRPI